MPGRKRAASPPPKMARQTTRVKLTFNLLTQLGSPLFCLPKELRDLIFAHSIDEDIVHMLGTMPTLTSTQIAAYRYGLCALPHTGKDVERNSNTSPAFNDNYTYRLLISNIAKRLSCGKRGRVGPMPEYACKQAIIELNEAWYRRTTFCFWEPKYMLSYSLAPHARLDLFSKLQIVRPPHRGVNAGWKHVLTDRFLASTPRLQSLHNTITLNPLITDDQSFQWMQHHNDLDLLQNPKMWPVEVRFMSHIVNLFRRKNFNDAKKVTVVVLEDSYWRGFPNAVPSPRRWPVADRLRLANEAKSII
ncbi:hypothetical protein BU16DRAFT_554143 [Lophium mytilinum]|uniref:Uncharacterized protein n=1 Tax=Lophium mytilinum TaxID=390894 RepID=A0A6A6RB93_9PEZI|nr:hypothetical protein BU16DRAFT_554143 [Lophium mytilinum]